MTFGGVFVEDTFFSSMSPMQGIHGLLTIQSPGLSLVSQQHIVLVSSSGVTNRNKGTYKVDSLRDFPILQEVNLLVFWL